MKRGFTLLEILVALAIASVIITLLFNSFFQMTGIITRADNIISINTRAVLVQHQLEKDIMGAFLPVQAIKEQDEKKLLDQTQTSTQRTPPTTQQEAEKKEKKERKELAKAFYGINRGGMLDVLTFITNNPMSAYWSAQTGKAKPKIARIVYRLVEDKNQKGSFTLLRQEGSKLEFESYAEGGSKEARAYPLAQGVKDLVVKYRVLLEPDEEKEEKKEVKKQDDTQQAAPKKEEVKKEKKKKEIKFQRLDQWDMEKELPKNVKRRIPNIVEVKITFWDDQEKRDASFEFSVPIIPEIREKSDKKDKEQRQQSGTQTTLNQSFPQHGPGSTTLLQQSRMGPSRSSQYISQQHVQAGTKDIRTEILRLFKQERKPS